MSNIGVSIMKGKVRSVDLKTGRTLKSIGPKGAIHASSDGRLVAIVFDNGALHFYVIKNAKLIRTIKYKDIINVDMVNGVALLSFAKALPERIATKASISPGLKRLYAYYQRNKSLLPMLKT